MRKLLLYSLSISLFGFISCGESSSTTADNDEDGNSENSEIISNTDEDENEMNEACQLLTREEAQEALGGGEPNDPLSNVRGNGTCQWTTNDGRAAELVVLVGQVSTFNLVSKAFKEDPTYETLSIGDQSFFVVKGLPRVDFIKGDMYISLTRTGSKEDVKAALIPMAQKLAARL